MHNELNYCKVLQRHLLPRLAFYFSPSPSVEQRKQHHILPAGLKLILKTRIHNECKFEIKKPCLKVRQKQTSMLLEPILYLCSFLYYIYIKMSHEEEITRGRTVTRSRKMNIKSPARSCSWPKDKNQTYLVELLTNVSLWS